MGWGALKGGRAMSRQRQFHKHRIEIEQMFYMTTKKKKKKNKCFICIYWLVMFFLLKKLYLFVTLLGYNKSFMSRKLTFGIG